MYSITLLKAEELLKTELDQLFEIHEIISKKYNFTNRFNTHDKFSEYIDKFKVETSHLYTIKENQWVIGFISIIKGNAWDGSELHAVKITYTKIVIEKELEDHIYKFINSLLYKYKKLDLILYNGELESLAKKYEGKIKFLCNYYSLTKNDINLDLLEETIKTLDSKNKNLSLRFFNGVPDEHIKEWCDIFNETSKDMPDEKEAAFIPYIATIDGQLKSKETMSSNNVSHYCYMVFNEQNEAIAESNVRIDNNDLRFPYQFMIGVKREFRGLGLGKWMYASMYKRLYEEIDFEKAEVVHHVSNHHAIRISEFIGYQFMFSEITYVLTET